MNRLNQTSLATLPSTVVKPSYDRSTLKPGIVHLGVGAFHRAHQAFYTEKVLNDQGGDWGIIGASLRSTAVGEQLNPQDGLYTVIEQSDDTCFQVIGCLLKVINAAQNPDELIAALAEKQISVVTLTITEKGYYQDPTSGKLQLDNPTIAKDIANYPAAPSSAIGFLVCGLNVRRKSGNGGITLLSCDNLSRNGQILQGAVLDFANQVDSSLVDWITANVTFPSSMVDRIVPASTVDELAQVTGILGVEDQGVVATEPFSQWVIENNFAGAVPDWTRAGALIVESVTPFEEMKLRLLNGSHSILAYLGFLAGYDFVHQVIGDDSFRALVRAFMDKQATPTLDVPAGFDLESYKIQLIERFANPALNHQTAQIAMDSSQKIPQRWLQCVNDLHEKQFNTDILALAIAGWIRYLQGVRESGEAYAIDDPLANEFSVIVDSASNSASDEQVLVNKVLGMTSVFGSLVSDYPEFAQTVLAFYQSIKNNGVKSTVEQVSH